FTEVQRLAILERAIENGEPLHLGEGDVTMAAGGEQLQQLLVLHRLRRGCLIRRPRGREGDGEGERGQGAGGPGSPPHAPAPGALAEAPAEAPAMASAPCQKS